MNFIWFTYLAIVPVREKPDDTSEIVTQLLFGDFVEVIEENRQWRKVRVLEDGYEGWLDHKMICQLTMPSESTGWLFLDVAVCHARTRKGDVRFNQPLFLGSRFPKEFVTIEGEQMVFRSGDLQVELPAGLLSPRERISGEAILKLAERYDGVPYLWGGKSFAGIDCSGYVQVVLQRFGVQMPRDAYRQVEIGTPVSLSEAGIGDLAYFVSSSGKVTHVGFVTGDGYVWHAHGRVRKDLLTEEGIVSTETGLLTHKLHSLRKM